MPRRNGCGKVVYRTRRAILRAIEHLPYNEKRQEKRAYFCRKCSGWHLTSKVLGNVF